MPDIDLFDNINTTAVRWLIWNSKKRKQPLGIRNFKKNNKIHLWLLYIMNSFSISMGYEDFYLECSWFDYFYIKYIKKIKHIKKMNNEINAFLIEPNLFAKEICEQFQRNIDIVQDIYDAYWNKSKLLY